MIVQASHVRLGDLWNGTREVSWAIPNYLKIGCTEVKFKDGETISVPNKQSITVKRELT